jgi:spermidine synthase
MDAIAFKNLPLTEDETGLWLDGKCIMYRKEEPYIKAGALEVCRRINPRSVLEFGFGYGYTASVFQGYGVEKHIIIEPHPEIAKRAIDWARDNNAVIVTDFWEYVRFANEFDLLYYDPFTMLDAKIDWSLYKYKWFADMAIEGSRNERNRFDFLIDNKTYSQMLERNTKC